MAKQLPIPAVQPVHRGRIQAQGPDTEQSEAWAQPDPPTKNAMIALLNALWDKLSSAEQYERQKCYEEVLAYIGSAPTTGIDAPLKKTFRNRKLRGGVRIDVEVQTGKAGIDDPI